MNIARTLAALALLSLAAPRARADDPVELKIATLAPEGSTWMKVFGEADTELRKKTGGAVRFRYYPGGIVGDEPTVIEKMGQGRIDGSAFSGLGIGQILPEIRILELPLLFASYEEYDHVVRGLQPEIESRLAAKGWKLIGLAEGGFANFFSTRPVRTLDDLAGTSIWRRDDDPLVERMFQGFQLTTRPSPLSSVVGELDARHIETVYSSPLTLLAFQWFPHLDYRVDLDLFNIQAAYVLRAESFERIPARHRNDLETIAAKHVGRLVERARADNREALGILEKRGIETVAMDPASRTRLQERADALAEDLVGEIYDRELYDQVLALRAEYRKGRG